LTLSRTTATLFDMTVAAGRRSRGEGWGRVVASISVAGTVLTVIAVLVLGVALYGFMVEFGGSPAPWWYWPSVLGFAVAGVLGLLLTSRMPRLALVFRLVGWTPLLAVGLSGPWLMAPAAVVGAAHISLLLTSWTQRLVVRLLAGVAVSVGLALLAVPVVLDLSCENVGDPPETCDAWYRSIAGWGVFEADDRHLAGWGVVVTLAGVLVAIPVPRRD
jgi:MFS family permease